MNNLQACTEKQVMTVKEIAQAMGVSYDTVNRCVKRIFPNKLQHGKTAYFDENEVACISKDIANNTDVQKHINNGGKFMTIRNVADVLGVSYSAVYRAVEKHFPDTLTNGKTTLLNEMQVACISKELKGDYHTSQLTFSAGEKVKNTTTRLEVLANYKAATQAMLELLEAEKAELQAENERQKQQLIEAAPKVDFYNAVISLIKNM